MKNATTTYRTYEQIRADRRARAMSAAARADRLARTRAASKRI